MITSFMQSLLHEGPREHAATRALHFTQLSHDNWVFFVLLWFWQINGLNSSEGFAPGWCANKKPRRSIRTAGFLNGGRSKV